MLLQEVQDYFKGLCNDVHIVKGEYDEVQSYPEHKVLTIGGFKLGICHGHQVRRPMLVPEMQALFVLNSGAGINVMLTPQSGSNGLLPH